MMNCPVCTTELKIADRQGIEIDFCPKCRGVWLDRGELDKIMERSSSELHDDYDDDNERRSFDRREREFRGNYRPHERKREGFFSRLFDFD
jgi:Zn-finger nucleic acid-binding protein